MSGKRSLKGFENLDPHADEGKIKNQENALPRYMLAISPQKSFGWSVTK